MSNLVRLLCLGLAGLLACNGRPKPETTPEPDKQSEKLTGAKPEPKLDRVPRMEFNRIAAELALPLFWVEDTNKDGALAPGELAVVYGPRPGALSEFVAGEKLTPALLEAYERIARVKAEGPAQPSGDEAEKARRAAVLKELSQGRPTIVASDLRKLSAEDRAFAKGILEAAKIVEKIYQMQRGSAGLEAQIPADDTASLALFYRNQGAGCVAPATEKDPTCSALPGGQKRVSGMYPASIQEDPAFCEALAKRKDADTLLHQFVVVREVDGKLVPVPYNEAYKAEMEQVSRLLTAAAAALAPDEAALKTYVAAAAQAFLDNRWEPADEAWAKMTAQNSKWYLRIGPDEVYDEPCSRKANFHVSFARINPGSIEWQNKLDPVKNDMEVALAALAGAPYKARKVSFHLPDFIDIVLNAGDSRDAHGATIGQSLPNWGPVANEGRGRTVAMTNFYTDADSKVALRNQVQALLCASAMANYTDDYGPQLMSSVLHEAAHNLGPAHEYKVKGKTDDQIFGGPLASTLEEFKAQSAALYFTDWLGEKGLITPEQVKAAHIRDVAWALGHVSRGMYNDQGKPKPYSQLAAFQINTLLKDGAATWNAEEMAANGSDKGCLSVDLEKFPASAKKLVTAAAGIKGRGDKKAAEALVKELVDGEEAKKFIALVTERWNRAAKASFVYSVDL